MSDVTYVKFYKVTSAQLAVDGQIEQGKFPDSLGQLKPDAYGPYLFQLQRQLLANQLALVPEDFSVLVSVFMMALLLCERKTIVTAL